MTDEQIEEFFDRLEQEYRRRGWWAHRNRLIDLRRLHSDRKLKERVWPVLSDGVEVDTRDMPEHWDLFRP